MLKKIKTKLLRKIKKIVPVYIPVLDSSLLTHRTALITGGTRGIGLSIAEAFVNNGANVIITGRKKDFLEKTVLELKEKTEKNNIYGVVLDLNSTNVFSEKIRECCSIFGKADILVNNAGLNFDKKFSQETEDNFDKTINTNLKGTYFFTQEFSKYLIKSNIQGNILNICSSSSLRPAITPYTLSKWGIRGFTMGLAKTLLPYGIIVNGLAPGPTATEMLIKDGYDGIENTRFPAGRYADAKEIANMAVILVSSISRMVVGDIIYMTGGSGLLCLDDIPYEF